MAQTKTKRRKPNKKVVEGEKIDFDYPYEAAPGVTVHGPGRFQFCFIHPEARAIRDRMVSRGLSLEEALKEE